MVRIGSPGKPKGQFPAQIRGFLGPGPSVLARTLLPLPAKPENHCTAYYPSKYPFQRPLGGGGPNNRSCCWLGSWVRNWIIKLDHIIGPEIGRSNFLKWTIQFPIQFPDPICPGIWPQSGVKENWIMQLDQKLDHRFRSTNWVMKLDRKLDHKIGS